MGFTKDADSEFNLPAGTIRVSTSTLGVPLG